MNNKHIYKKVYLLVNKMNEIDTEKLSLYIKIMLGNKISIDVINKIIEACLISFKNPNILNKAFEEYKESIEDFKKLEEEKEKSNNVISCKFIFGSVEWLNIYKCLSSSDNHKTLTHHFKTLKPGYTESDLIYWISNKNLNSNQTTINKIGYIFNSKDYTLNIPKHIYDWCFNLKFDILEKVKNCEERLSKITDEDYKKLFVDVEKKISDVNNEIVLINEYNLFSCLLPPRRPRDVALMYIENDEEEFNEQNENKESWRDLKNSYYPSCKTLVFRNYKTRENYGVQIFNLNDYVNEKITSNFLTKEKAEKAINFLDKMPRNAFLCNGKNKKTNMINHVLTLDEVEKYVKSFENFFKRSNKVNNNVFRHYWAQISNDLNKKDKILLGCWMSHNSLSTSLLYSINV
jgi:hypothetical protein